MGLLLNKHVFFDNFVDNGTESFVRGSHSLLAGFWYYNLVQAYTIAPAAASNWTASIKTGCAPPSDKLSFFMFECQEDILNLYRATQFANSIRGVLHKRRERNTEERVALQHPLKGTWQPRGAGAARGFIALTWSSSVERKEINPAG